MNILYILPELNVGGVETHVLSLALGMKRAGNGVTVVSNGGVLVGRLEEGGVEHVTMGVHRKSPFSVGELAREVGRICGERDIQIVHAHSRVPAWIGHFATRKRRAAFVITAHGQYAPHLGSRVMAWGDHIICVSQIIKEHMEQKLGADPSRTSVIYNGIDMEEALRMQAARRPAAELRAELGIPEGAPAVGAVGRLTLTKGLRYFVEAVAAMAKTRPDVRALLIGDGPLKKELADLARSLGVADNVIFTGMRSDIYSLLGALDAYVVSSLYEGFPMGCLEAMSSRVPIVATRVGGIPEMLEDGKTALLVDPRNPAQLAEKIGRLIGDAKLRGEIGAAGFDKVRTRFSLENTVGEARQVYEKVLREKYRIYSFAAPGPRPKVLLTLPELRVGGVETHVIDLARGLKRKGYGLTVVSFGGKLVENLERDNIEHIKLPVHSKSPTVIFDMVGRMKKVFEEGRIDLVHAHSRVPAWVCYMALKSGRRDVPFVTTCHSTYSVHPGSRVMTWSDGMIGVSEFVRKHMLNNFGTPPEKIVTVHNGISPLLFDEEKVAAAAARYRAELSLGPNTRVVGMVASLTPRKGYIFFIRAAEKILAEHPDTVFLAVGGGAQSQELEGLARELRLGDKFRFLGVRQDVRDLLGAFDIFVLSSMSEGLPYVILEAMCMKKPIVTTNVGGIPEAIEHGANGMLVQPRDVDALAASILSLLRDRNMASSLGEAAHARIRESFTVERMVDHTEQVYVKTLG